MEINGNNPLIGLTKNVQRLDSPQQLERARKSGGAHSDADRLELSVRSLEIAHLEDLIRSTPDIRQERVDQVRREIESGAYNIKAGKIAEKIIGGDLFDEFL